MGRRKALSWLSTLSLVVVMAAPAAAQAPDPHLQDALWVAETEGLLKVAVAGGELLFEIPGLQNVRAVAVDERRATVWLYAERTLRAYGFDGEARLSTPISSPNPAQASLAVRQGDGSVWLGSGKDLWSVSATGQILHSLRLPGNVEALSIDEGHGRLWVATKDSVAARDLTSAAALSELELGPQAAVRDVSVDPVTADVWVGLRESALRYRPDGQLAAAAAIQGVRRVAATAQGAWVAAGGDLFQVGPSGALTLRLEPFHGGAIVELAADRRDGSVWLAGTNDVAHVSAGGELLRYLEFQPPAHLWDLAFYADRIPPEIEILSPSAGSWLDTRRPSVELRVIDIGSGFDPASLALRANGAPAAVDCAFRESGASCTPTADLAEGSIALSATVADFSGNLSQPAETSFTVDTIPPDILLTTPADGSVTDQPEVVIAGSLSEAAVLTVGGQAVPVAADLSFALAVALEEGPNPLALAAEDRAGNRATLSLLVIRDSTPPGSGLPPDPATVAPPLDRTVATDLAAATRFLYEGSAPIQTGVAPETIDPGRVAIIRGRVLDRYGAALPGARIRILHHPELGSTLSRADGMFDLAVNGGGTFIIEYEKEGFLPVQRRVDTPWRDYVWAEDVALIPYDSVATRIVPGASGLQIARGSESFDEDGSRRATLLFPPGTEASLVLPDGSTRQLSTLTVRATEYTVGPTGPTAMPAPLPPETAYTYAVELSVDEAVAAGAPRVIFTQPVIQYVENFLNFPVGSPVPAGYYDRHLSAWVPSDNGRIVRILGHAGGLADLDITGDGSPASAAALAALGITEAERRQLAALYTPGQSLWRVPIPHFTPWDYNWPFAPPDDADFPGQPDPETDEPEDDPCEQPGSVIECQNQILGEEAPVVGTPYSLHYRSDRVPGRVESNTLRISLSGPAVPPSLRRIELEILVAGRRFTQSFPPAPNQSYTFVWDGKDAYGRELQGKVLALANVGYVYAGVYQTAGARFASAGGGLITGSPLRKEIVLWQRLSALFGGWNAREQGLGAWSLNVHHVYDPGRRTLYLGDGRRRARRSLDPVVTHAAGTPLGPLSEGIPATQARLLNPTAIAVRPDGGFYIAEQGGNRIRLVDRRGIIRTVAGRLEAGFAGDGGLATNALLTFPTRIALGAEGSLYIVDRGNHCIRRIDPNGVIRTVAGRGTADADGVPATQARLLSPGDVAVAPDGTLYISEFTGNRVRKVGPDGIITTVAGTGAAGFGGDLGQARLARLRSPNSLALDQDGNLYIDDFGNERIRRVRPTGVIETVVGGGSSFFFDGLRGPELNSIRASGLAAAPDGSLLITGLGPRLLRLDTEGVLTTVGGFGSTREEGSLATQYVLIFPVGVAVGPAGEVYLAESSESRIPKLSPPSARLQTGTWLVPSDDAQELFVFDDEGRHLETLDMRTGSAFYRFSYDASGFLTHLQDASGNLTRIERSGAAPSAIVAPFGQRTRLSLDAQGYLAEVTNPAGETLSFTYGSGGLMSSMRDAKQAAYSFHYDSVGRLLRDEDPAHGAKTLARQLREGGYTVDIATALGRTTSYTVDRPAGSTLKTATSPSGAITQTVSTGASHSSVAPDGTRTTVLEGPDPRFGMLSPYVAGLQIRTPSGLHAQLFRRRQAVLARPDDLLSLVALRETLTLNGRTFEQTYDVSQRKLTFRTPEGRRSTATIDDRGRPLVLETDGLEPVAFVYDDRGRLASISQGSGEERRSVGLAYGADGWLAAVTDPLARQSFYAWDEAGRVRQQALPGERVIDFSYDANGNVTSIVPPGRPSHAFGYTPVDLPSEYAPPDLGTGTVATTYHYNLDRQLTQMLRPDGTAVDLSYDPAGRLAAITSAEGQTAYTYSPADRLTGVTAPGGEKLTYSYDGFLLTNTSWSGPVAGSVGRAYDNNFHLVSQSVNGADAVTFGYDADGLLTRAGALTIQRNPQNGLPTGTSLGQITTTQAYNSFGEITTFQAHVAGTSVFTTQYARDRLGRIVQKIETLGGITDTYEYTYDAPGRLSEVHKNGARLSHYDYDANSNRTAHATPSETVTATYDAQDRLLTYGDATYTYTANGEVATKSQNGHTVHYDYDEFGNLRKVTLPDGIHVEYVIDGQNRRVGKKINGVLVQGFLYQNQLNPIAELDGNGNVISRFIYGSRPNVPDYMVKDGATYRIVADHLGSPRLVVKVQTGEIVQRLDYDEFGRVILVTNLGFQPFGFAGGIHDRQTGLVRLGARDYSPETGTWTAKDPSLFSGGDVNLFAYSLNDPANLVDTNGRTPIAAPVVVGGLVATTFAVIAWEVWLKTPAGQEFLKDLPNPFAGPWESRRPKYKPGAPGKICPPPVAIPGARPRTTPPPPLIDVDPENIQVPGPEELLKNKKARDEFSDRLGEVIDKILDGLQEAGQ